MEGRRRWGAIAAILLSLVGAVLLGVSFLATGADMGVVTGDRWEEARRAYEPFVALCVEDKLVVLTFRDQQGNLEAAGRCPVGDRHPVAEVTYESRALFVSGWLAVILGGIVQIRLATLPALPAKWG